VELDTLDYQILGILKQDSRTPFTEVGRLLGVSDATIHVRVNRMVEEGVIKEFTLTINEEMLGRKVHAFILMNVQPGFIEEVAAHLMNHDEVNVVYEIHGPNDLIVEVETDDLLAMRNLMLTVRETPHVTTSELTTILKVWKKNNA
jgi:Lrp/AsnC family transcriptional regulator for asnA, asnC and gidA